MKTPSFTVKLGHGSIMLKGCVSSAIAGKVVKVLKVVGERQMPYIPDRKPFRLKRGCLCVGMIQSPKLNTSEKLWRDLKTDIVFILTELKIFSQTREHISVCKYGNLIETQNNSCNCHKIKGRLKGAKYKCTLQLLDFTSLFFSLSSYAWVCADLADK